MGLLDKVAMVMSIGRGIGLAIAREGAQIVIPDVDPKIGTKAIREAREPRKTGLVSAVGHVSQESLSLRNILLMSVLR